MKSALVVALIPILLAIFFHKSFMIVCVLLLLPLPIAEVIKNYNLTKNSIYYAMQIFTWFALIFVCGVFDLCHADWRNRSTITVRCGIGYPTICK